VGEWQGSGYLDRQWLIERDGRFIQVSELLYRIAEQANGERTIPEIAARVTEATEWLVSADQVWQLVKTKLLPLRIIALADGSGARRDRVGDRSPLQVHLRTRKTIGPRVTDPVTRLFQGLYSPLVLVPALLAIAASHAWLYVGHGVTGSLRNVAYSPGLVPVVVGLLGAAAAFHELGHAAALRYGGGQVRGMGAGFYLFYPVFYTDVTDSYRLGRWARVRTDLGGVYFHLLFALGLVVSYLASRQEYLLLAAALIDLEVARQFLPMGRLDGYWALADLAGIPDFISQIGPYLRSMLPGPRPKVRTLPRLKRQVKAVLALYSLVTVGCLAGLCVLVVAGMPGFMRLTWDALLVQALAVSGAQVAGDVPGMALAIVQMVLLGLPILGTGHFLYTLSRGLVGSVRLWSKPAPKAVGSTE
jgi:putative peptide zinc metalloprotease protein